MFPISSQSISDTSYLDSDLADDEYDKLLNNDNITNEMLLDLYNIERRLQNAGTCFLVVYHIKLTL